MAANPMLARMQELLVHHYNMAGALGREAAAKGAGLDPEPYRHPYPGSTNYTFNVVTPGEAKAEAKAIVEPGLSVKSVETTTTTTAAPPAAKRSVLPWVLSGLLGTGLSAGGLAWLLQPHQTLPAPATQPATAPAPPAAGKQGIVYEVYERDEHGGWKKSDLTMDQLLGGKPLP